MVRARAFLQTLQVVGYGNLALLVYLLLAMKVSSELWLPFALAFAVAILGSIAYFAFWNQLFPQIPKAEGRIFMRPYLLALAVAIAAAALVLGLHLFAAQSSP